MAVAAGARRFSEGTVLLVVPTDADIENTVGDVCFFLSVLEGSATAVVERQVLPFPSTQVDPYRGFQPHFKVASARARVLHALASNTARVVVAYPEAALALVRQAERGLDSAEAAAVTLPMRLEALAALGRASEAQATLDAYASHATPELQRRQRAIVAWAWVRAGDVARARALLGTDSTSEATDVSGWLALYSGDLGVARRTLRVRGRATPELVTAMALLARTKADTSAATGNAFLMLARGDTLRAATAFEEAAVSLQDARTLLISVAARLHAATRDDARAILLWSELATKDAAAPEAPEANLEWARALRRAGKHAEAVERLEHLILTYPNSALVPQARRELDLARGAIPRAS
jgi:tetratricopeptide (TPR) repeat protein